MNSEEPSRFEIEREKINRKILFLRFVILMLLPVICFTIYIGDVNDIVVIALVSWCLIFFVAFVVVFLMVCPQCGSMVFANGMLSFRLKKCKDCGFSLKKKKGM